MGQEKPITTKTAAPFDLETLGGYLCGVLSPCAGKTDIVLQQIIAGLSNPTFFLKLAGQRYVLRKQPAGKLLPSAHVIDREYRVLNALSIPNLHEYVSQYFANRGLKGTFDPYYAAFAFFRLAVIFEGIRSRTKQGNQAASKSQDLDKYSRISARHGLVLAGVN